MRCNIEDTLLAWFFSMIVSKSDIAALIPGTGIWSAAFARVTRENLNVFRAVFGLEGSLVSASALEGLGI